MYVLPLASCLLVSFFHSSLWYSIYSLTHEKKKIFVALVILKIFSREFIPIGTVFTVYGVLVLLIAWYRRSAATRLFLVDHPHHPRNNPDEVIHTEEEEDGKVDPKDLYFVTSGMSVILLTVASVFSYIALLVLLYLM